ncbi:uncharacterized protein LOC126313008 isoform X2 [Schistocerca gregaria]|uniref:uncharacterized protein LOC126313008 isoform X2 n=1 Tax=Schistocerca gregaria TaxID=7010 RepID=UPI00211DFE60|nr:uncharacterized protein LOC126313008 isoform X2 [Schistocerca gregaria]
MVNVGRAIMGTWESLTRMKNITSFSGRKFILFFPFIPLIITLSANLYLDCFSAAQIRDQLCVLSSVVLFGLFCFLLKEVLQEYWLLENGLDTLYEECRDLLKYLQSPSTHGNSNSFGEETMTLRNMWQQGDYHKLQDMFPVARKTIPQFHGKQQVSLLHQFSSARTLKS